MDKKVDIKIRGHESFYLREGWLRKGISGIIENPYCLSDTTNGVDTLGVGANMVKAIRYWLQAVGLTYEIRGEKGKRLQKLTEGFGDIIIKNDPYFENLGSLYLLHYKLVTNLEYATSWYIFFNRIGLIEVNKESLEELLEKNITNINRNYKISKKSLGDDATCIIKTYALDKNDTKEPEENTICPFTSLGLAKKVKNNMIIKTSPDRDKIDRLIILYVINENLNEKGSTTIMNLIEDEMNIGKVFNLDKNMINEYIDCLSNEGYLNINRAAGLNTIYLSDKANNILQKYYDEQ